MYHITIQKSITESFYFSNVSKPIKIVRVPPYDFSKKPVFLVIQVLTNIAYSIISKCLRYSEPEEMLLYMVVYGCVWLYIVVYCLIWLYIQMHSDGTAERWFILRMLIVDITNIHDGEHNYIVMFYTEAVEFIRAMFP